MIIKKSIARLSRPALERLAKLALLTRGTHLVPSEDGARYYEELFRAGWVLKMPATKSKSGRAEYSIPPHVNFHNILDVSG